MPDQRRTITLSVKDDFSRQLQQFARMVGESEGELSDFQKTMGSGGGFMSGVRNIRDMTLAFNGMVQSIGAVARAVDEFATLGTTARRNEFVLKQLTGTTKEYEAALNAVTSALKGTVTEGEAAAIASQLLNLGLADSAEGIEEFTRISNVIAAMSPTIKTADEAIAQIGLTIANMSFMRLDQLGLSVADVKERMKELQAATADMTTEAAFQQAVMEGLSAKADLLGDGLIEIGAGAEQAKAKLRGFKENIAKEVSAALDDAFIAASQLYDILQVIDGKTFVIKLAQEFGIDTNSPEWKVLEKLVGVGEAGIGVATFGMTTLEAKTPAINPDYMGEWDWLEQYTGITQSEIQALQDFPISLSLNPTIANPAEFQSQFNDGVMSLVPGADDPLPVLMSIAPEIEIVSMGAARPQVGGGAGQLPGRLPTDIEMIVTAHFGVDQQSKLSVMDEILGVSKEFDPATSGFAQAREEAAALHAELKGAAQETRALAGAGERFAESMEMANIDPDSFNVSVLAEMRAALGAVDIEANLAAEAIQNYELATGLASASTFVFEGQMAVLAQDFANGAMSAGEYVAAVQELSLMDMSQIDAVAQGLIDSGDVQMAQEFIDVLSGPDGVAEFEEGMANAQMLLENLGLIPEEETPLQPILTDLDAVTAYLEDVESKWVPPIESAMNLATGEVTTFRETAVNDIDAIKAALERLKGNFTISVSTDLSGIGGGETESTVGGVPEFAEGGFTGNSTAPFLAMLHPNELVIPLDDLGAPGGGMQAASSDPIVVETTIMVNDFVLAQAVEEAKRKEGATV